MLKLSLCGGGAGFSSDSEVVMVMIAKSRIMVGLLEDSAGSAGGEGRICW